MVTLKHTGECLGVICGRRRTNTVSESGVVQEKQTCTPVQKPQAARHRKQKIMTKLSDSGFEEDFPFASPSPIQTRWRHPGPETSRSLHRLLLNWYHNYGEIVYNIQKDKEKLFHPFKCLERQPQVTAEARCKLVSWLIPVHRHFRLSFECSCLAVNIMDRFLASTPVAADCFQLLGVTTLLLASKQVEVFSPRISQLLSLCCHAFSREQLCNLECLILLRLNFRLAAPTLAFFLDHYTNHSLAGQEVGGDVEDSRLPVDGGEEGGQLPSGAGRCSSLARRVCELSLADYAFNKYPPSLTALCAVKLANELLEKGQDLAECMDQSETEDRTCDPGEESDQGHCMDERDHTSVDNDQASIYKDHTLSVGGTQSVTEHTPLPGSPTLNDLTLGLEDNTHGLARECRDNLKLLVSLNKEALLAMITL
ncbi:cyclin-O isoform X2 [Osmerus eperlanus]|uniref:cyclin-O isoform X2 n=1 Tax=Osmerus eperlanus TaxID=29151 RepID=UPI002E0FB017